jgi:5-methylcytosine-specific restriction protein A
VASTMKATTINDRTRLIQRELESVASSLGIRMSYQQSRTGSSFDYKLRLDGVSAPNGFAVHVGDDYLLWHLELDLDAFGAPLLDLMSMRFRDRRGQFEAYAALATSRNFKVQLLVNGASLPEASEHETWTDFKIVIVNGYETDKEALPALHSALLDIFCLVLCLLIEQETWEKEVDEEEIADALEGDFEGAGYQKLVKKYERSRYNRAICLSHFGFTCRGCGQNMKEVYGPIGEGVIHVHHIVPLSQIGGSYKIDPLADLIPLCPNCHNVVHRVTPPLSIDNLRRSTKYSEKSATVGPQISS